MFYSPHLMESFFERWKQRASVLNSEARAVYLASRDPRVPWYAKALAICVLGYLLSPIDLIPDFIPVLGYLDDLLIVPSGLLLVIRLIPTEVMAEHRAAARVARFQAKPNWAAAAVIVAVWILLLVLTARFLWHKFAPN